MRKLLLPLLVASAVMSPSIYAVDFSDKIKQAMKSEIRTDRDKARDENRKPAETLAFFGIKEDMKVLEIIPGGGWYSKLLAPALKDKGQLYLSMGTGYVNRELMHLDTFEDVKLVGEKDYEVKNLDFGVKGVDAVLTFRNYHNFDEDERTKINKAAFKSLKPGGVYGVVNHTRRHMQKKNDENGRRFDPVLAIKEIQQAGFTFVDYSNLHYKSDDELRFEVGKKTVRGNSDRFTLLFKKPE